MSGNELYLIKPKRNKPTRKNPLVAGLTAFLIVIFLFICVGIIAAVANGGTQTKSANNQFAQSAAKQSAAIPHTGATVSDAGFNFVVNSIKCGETHISTHGLINYYSDAQGQYCRLNVTLTNTGNSANSIDASDQYTFNSQGQRYDPASNATANAAGDYSGTPLNDDINPGNTVTGDIVYDVPVGTTPTMAELHGDYGSKGVKVNLQ